MSNGYHVAVEKEGTLSFVTVWLNLGDRHRVINVNTVFLWDSLDWPLTPLSPTVSHRGDVLRLTYYFPLYKNVLACLDSQHGIAYYSALTMPSP